ncbi:DUF4145 domain-containing protein [Methylibium sp.]|uniref:DUF4145 domain-containing protein n=1 Tax=Methylibium sp. TaxID=2067992 RepID=UPI003D110B51
MRLDPLISRRLAELDARADAILAARTTSSFREKTLYHVLRSDAIGWASSVATLIERVFGESSFHLAGFKDLLKNFNGYEHEFRSLHAVLRAAKEDYEGGYLFSVVGLAKAEAMDDAISQAASLLSADYKDAAAVLCGVALEVTLKHLAGKHSLAAGKLDMMNVALCKASVFNVTKQQQITAWAAIRNRAAHGEWAAYTKSDVENMLQGVQGFVADYLQ